MKISFSQLNGGAHGRGRCGDAGHRRHGWWTAHSSNGRPRSRDRGRPGPSGAPPRAGRQRATGGGRPPSQHRHRCTRGAPPASNAPLRASAVRSTAPTRPILRKNHRSTGTPSPFPVGGGRSTASSPPRSGRHPRSTVLERATVEERLAGVCRGRSTRRGCRRREHPAPARRSRRQGRPCGARGWRRARARSRRRRHRSSAGT